MKLFKIVKLGVLLFSAYLLVSCDKDFLEEKPNSTLIVPTSLKDFQQLLDRDRIINEMPELGELSSDNYYLSSTYWENLPSKERNSYVWAADLYEGKGNIPDWNYPYQQMFYANVVLEGLGNVSITVQNYQEWNHVKGRALFVRAFALYNVAQIFAPVYDQVSAHKEYGIPLRLMADINVPSVRATVRETYDQILSDLKTAASLLTNSVDNNNPNRPSKPAVYAMLARTYLSMRDYEQAFLYADSCLQLYSSLIDYNTLSIAASIPFPINNKEVLYQGYMNYSSQVLRFRVFPDVIVDSTLYQSYNVKDLRKQLFFKLNAAGIPNGKDGYLGSMTSTAFGGPATDEIYLIRAECLARMGDAAGAIDDLNTLLEKRYITGEYVDYSPTTSEEALALILEERRKELIFRGLRWSDLRRLNKEGANIELKRLLNGQEYTLPPGDSRYTLPIPPDENIH